MKKASAILASFFAATVAFAAPTLTPNSVKYRDSSKPHATGRSGNATLDAVAMIGIDGTTTISVASNGNLDKVQLQADGDNTVNVNAVGDRSFTQNLSDFAPHQAIRVQANVSGVDPRTDVVSADEIIKYRPDLAVTHVAAPQSAMPGTPFLVSATVAERNGDLGARANCVLSADGAEVDRSTGIWVDAGDSVSCMFSATLSAMGAHSLTVTVRDVHPGDYDDTNNAASASITISEPFAGYDVDAMQSNYHTDKTVAGPGLYEQSTTDQKLQQYSFGGTYAKLLDLDRIWMRVRETTDGAFVSDTTSDGMLVSRYDDSDGGISMTCRDGLGDSATYRVCNRTMADGSSFFSFAAMRWSGSVNYVTHNAFLGYDSNGNPMYGDAYTHSENGVQGPDYGSTVSLDVTVTDGSTTLQATPTVALSPMSVDRGVHRTCRSVRGGSVCTEVHTIEEGVRGSVHVDGSY